MISFFKLHLSHLFNFISIEILYQKVFAIKFILIRVFTLYYASCSHNCIHNIPNAAEKKPTLIPGRGEKTKHQKDPPENLEKYLLHLFPLCRELFDSTFPANTFQQVTEFSFLVQTEAWWFVHWCTYWKPFVKKVRVTGLLSFLFCCSTDSEIRKSQKKSYLQPREQEELRAPI